MGPFDFGDAYISQQRWQAEEARRREEADYVRRQRAIAEKRQQQEDAAWSNYAAVEGGLGQAMPALQSVGYTPDQIAAGMAARGGAQGFLEQAKKYANDVDSSDLATTPASALQSRASALTSATVVKPRQSALTAAMAGVAAARRDIGALKSLQAAGKDERYDEAIVDAHARWNGMNDAARTDYLAALSREAGVPGVFSHVKGKIGKDEVEYIHFNPDGQGNGYRIDPDDAAHIFAARQAMEVDPRRAMAEIRSMKQDAQKWALHLLDVKLKGAGLENETARGLAGLRIQDRGERDRTALGWAQLASTDAYHKGMLKLQGDRNERERWSPLGASEDGSQLVMYGQGGDFKTLAMPPGVNASTFFPKQAPRLRLDGTSGLFMNEHGVPVGKVDSAYGIVPLEPAPKASAEAERKLAMAGVRPAVATPNGIPRWGWMVPNNVGEGFVTYDNPEEAAAALVTAPTSRQLRNAQRRAADPASVLGVEGGLPWPRLSSNNVHR